jgi:hypothetical protein
LTSWGTMGIFYPIVVPLVWQVLLMNGLADPDHMFILYSSVACVLSGHRKTCFLLQVSAAFNRPSYPK